MMAQPTAQTRTDDTLSSGIQGLLIRMFERYGSLSILAFVVVFNTVKTNETMQLMTAQITEMRISVRSMSESQRQITSALQQLTFNIQRLDSKK